MSRAFAAPIATCRLGVTGGNETVFIGGVVGRWSMSSSSDSAGGVTGVATVPEAIGVGSLTSTVFLYSSIAAHFVHSSCLRYMYCC